MAAVASTSSPEGIRGLNHDRPFADPNHASGFTAVNSQSSPTMKVNAVVNGHEPSATAPEENHPRPTLPPIRRQPSPPREQTNTAAPMPPQNNSQSPNKRKRSYAEEDESRNNHSYHGHGYAPPPPPPADRQEPLVTSPRINSPYMNGRAGIEEPSRRISADAQRPLDSPHYGPPRPMGNDYDSRGPPPQPYYSHQPPPPPPGPGPPRGSTEARLVDALQRDEEINGNHQTGMSAEYGSPEDDDGQNGQYGKYGSGPRSLSGADQERISKRRKRVFSNRTKTGCLTCRKRKKKCDEAHPECELPHACTGVIYPRLTIIRQ